MEGGGGPLVARAAELAWVIDYKAEVNSDLSVFHRVDDPETISSARYTELVELLPAYRGAVRAAALREAAEDGPGPPRIEEGDFVSDWRRGAAGAASRAATGDDVVVVDDIATLAVMSQTPGFPGIEYSGG